MIISKDHVSLIVSLLPLPLNMVLYEIINLTSQVEGIKA